MEPVTIGLIASVVVAGVVALGSLIASVCTYFSFKESASASSSDEQCVKVDNTVTKEDKNGNKVVKEQHISIHNTCLEQMQKSTSLKIPMENKTATAVGNGAVGALGGIAGGVGGALGGGGSPTDILGQVAGMAGTIATNATNQQNMQNPQDTGAGPGLNQPTSMLPLRDQKQDNINNYDPRLLPTTLQQGNNFNAPPKQPMPQHPAQNNNNFSDDELLLFDQYGQRVYIDVTQNGSDIEVNIYHDNDQEEWSSTEESSDKDIRTQRDKGKSKIKDKSKGKEPDYDYYSDDLYDQGYDSSITVDSEEIYSSSSASATDSYSTEKTDNESDLEPKDITASDVVIEITETDNNTNLAGENPDNPSEVI